jgi:ribose-phosphate pyrophosphokinase
MDDPVDNVAIHCLPENATDAGRLAACLGLPLHRLEIHAFPDGELRVSAWPAAAVAILYASLDQPNDKLLALLFAAEALRRNGCERLVLVAPYLCYMRQDIAFHAGEAISQKVVGRLISNCFDRIVTVDAHLHRTARLGDVCPGIEADNLSAMGSIAGHLSETPLDPRTILVGPDAESQQWVAELSKLLGVSYAVASKLRRGDHSVRITLDNPEIFVGRSAVIVDDVVSSGGTMTSCAEALLAAGACSVDAIVVHALFPSGLMSDFTKSGIRSVRSTTSVPHFTNAIPLDNLLSDALRSELVAARSREKSV